MKQYKLTEQESRVLATNISTAYNKVSPNTIYPEWIEKYMETYNTVMSTIDDYNSKVSDD